MTVYRVKDWNLNFESAESRKLKAPRWVPVPNKFDGLSYRRLTQRPDAGAVFAGWVLILQCASKCPERGLLANEDGPLTPEDLALMTGFPASMFKTALTALSDRSIGWLVAERWQSKNREDGQSPDSPGASAGTLADDPGEPGDDPDDLPLKEGKEERTEGGNEPAGANSLSPARSAGAGEPDDGNDPAPEACQFPDFPCSAGKRSRDRVWRLTEGYVRELSQTYPAVDVRQQCRAAWQWVKANIGRRKTAAGMPDFLRRWMAKEQDRPRQPSKPGGVDGEFVRKEFTTAELRDDLGLTDEEIAAMEAM